jgi:hypothetical protein
MADRQFLVAREVAETRRRMAPPVLARVPDTRSDGRPPRLGLSHPRIDGNPDQPSRRRYGETSPNTLNPADPKGPPVQ